MREIKRLNDEGILRSNGRRITLNTDISLLWAYKLLQTYTKSFIQLLTYFFFLLSHNQLTDIIPACMDLLEV
jgi:hypothetical protein